MYSLVFLAAAMFFIEMNIGPIWAFPMDIAYDRSGTASGIMSGNGLIAAIVSPVVAGYLVDHLGNWNVAFMLSIGVMVCGAVMSFVMKPDVAFADHRQPGTPRVGRETLAAARRQALSAGRGVNHECQP
jgi:MFS family permease